MSPQLSYRTHTIAKLNTVLREIENLKAADFPYEEPRQFLQELSAFYSSRLSRLESIDDNADAKLILSLCSQANFLIAKYHPLLGFMLRSTNVRNSFEIFDPVLRICQNLLGPTAKLILSSEWDYSPFTYTLASHDFPDYVLIGLPASESSNALILPLAGHELGHTVWRRAARQTRYKAKIQELVFRFLEDNVARLSKLLGSEIAKADVRQDLFINELASQSIELSARQLEEIFCDVMGVRVFGASYAKAFEYLVAPNFGGRRADIYPPLRERAQFIARACTYFGFEVVDDFSLRFIDSRPDSSPIAKLQVDASDFATAELVNEILDDVKEECDKKKVVLSQTADEQRTLDYFGKLIPDPSPKALAPIINAGWAAYLGPMHPLAKSHAEWTDLVNELILKTIEVLEYRHRIEAV